MRMPALAWACGPAAGEAGGRDVDHVRGAREADGESRSLAEDTRCGQPTAHGLVRALARGSPIPVPSTAVCSAPRRSKGMKMRSMFSGDRPGPVSETVMMAWPAPSSAQEIVMLPPRWLYLTALEIRLTRTWESRCRSAWTARAGCVPGWMIRIERSAAIGAIS